MKKILVGLATLVLTVVGAGTAAAVTTDQYDHVKYVFCSNDRTGNEVTYYDALGQRDQVLTLNQNNDGLYCGSISYTEPEKYGSFIWSSIQNDHASYVYCAIWVNGTITERSEDRSDYGAWALC